MEGVNISAERALELWRRGYDIYRDPAAGFWVGLGGLGPVVHDLRAGKIASIPDTAVEWESDEEEECTS